jgi:hypothetical protein
VRNTAPTPAIAKMALDLAGAKAEDHPTTVCY